MADINALAEIIRQLSYLNSGGTMPGNSTADKFNQGLDLVGKAGDTLTKGITGKLSIDKQKLENQKLKNDLFDTWGSQLNLPAEQIKNQIFQNQTASQSFPGSGAIYPQPSAEQENPSSGAIPVTATTPLPKPETPGLDFFKAHPELNPGLSIEDNAKALHILNLKKESDRTPRPVTEGDVLVSHGLKKIGQWTTEDEMKMISGQYNAEQNRQAATGRQQAQLGMTQQQIDLSRANLAREKGNDATRAFDTLTSAIRTKMADPNITPEQSSFLNDQLQYAAQNGSLPETSVSGMKFLGINLPSDFPFGKPIQTIVPKTPKSPKAPTSGIPGKTSGGNGYKVIP